jgi:hypothetical protein
MTSCSQPIPATASHRRISRGSPVAGAAVDALQTPVGQRAEHLAGAALGNQGAQPIGAIVGQLGAEVDQPRVQGAGGGDLDDIRRSQRLTIINTAGATTKSRGGVNRGEASR